MSRRKDKKAGTQRKAPRTNGAWLSMRTGLTGMIALSLALAGWTAWQVHAFRPWWESLLWGLGFGAAIWLVFALALGFNRWVRKKKTLQK